MATAKRGTVSKIESGIQNILAANVLAGLFNSEKQKHGFGIYTWMEADEDGGQKKVAVFEGQYFDGKKHGLGKMTFPNGDVYHGQWKDNKVAFSITLIVHIL
jgi:hypothetical protein